MEKYLNSESILRSLANMRQLVFEVTDACNLKCKYCGYGEMYEDYDIRGEKMLPVGKAFRLINYLVNFGIQTKIGQLKLNVLSESNLLDREMNALRGGNECTCSCYYVNSKGSSSDDNMNENYLSNYNSTSGCNQYILTDYRATYCDTCTDN